MLAKRIIPCLDVTGGRVVKGVNFVELRDAGDPVEIAARYNDQGADELTFLDITATSDGRDLILHIIEAVASQVFIPLTVGGGVRTVEDVRRLLNAGADKTSFNSAAIANPQVIRDASQKYGAQCIVVAIDAKLRKGDDIQLRGGAGLIALPAAFTLQTGKDHWEVLCRARAIETETYFVATGQTGNHLQGNETRTTWGHSLVVDPWGHVVARASDGVGYVTARIEPDRVTRVRTMIPVAQHKVRFD